MVKPVLAVRAAFVEQSLQRIHETARIFMHLGDGGTFNAPGEPMLDPLSASLFLVGLALAVRRWRFPKPEGGIWHCEELA